MTDNLPELPDSERHERIVIGSMLVDTTTAHEMAALLTPDAFSCPPHQFLFQTICEELQVAPPNVVTIIEKLRKTRLIRRARGEGYITQLVDDVASVATAKHHATIILERHKRRELLKFANDLSESAKNGKELPDIIEDAEKQLFSIGLQPSTSIYKPMSDVMPNVMLTIEQRIGKTHATSGIQSGFHEIDDCILGFDPGQLVVIAARTGAGKTSFCLNLARNISKKGLPTAFVSLEMSEEALTEKLLALEAGIDSRSIRSGGLYHQDVDKLVEASGKVAGYPIHIDDGAHQTVFDIRSKARRLMSQTKGKLAAIFIDYLQLIHSRDLGDNRHQAVSGITKSLKALAKELKMPVFLVSQLKRPQQGQEDRRPFLTDLKESGDIENDADLVIFLYRPGQLKAKEKTPGLTDVIIAKHRMGPTRTLKLMHNLPTSRFLPVSRNQGLDKEEDTGAF